VTTEREHSDPVFVVGMNGSGTTMLLDCLGRHPSLYAFPKETRLIPYLMAREQSHGDLSVDANFRALWEEVLALPAFREANGRQPLPLPEDWQEQPRGLSAVLDAVFRRFAAREGKRRWCEKSPQYVQHLPALAHAFPRARFVHVIRDGRDCAVSFHRRWKRQPELTVFRWKKVVSMGREHGRRLGPGRYLEVHYEELTTRPEPALRRICEFLEVPFDPRVLESAQPYLQASGVPQSVGGLRHNSGKWRGYFREHTVERLERIAGRTLAGCGYETRWPDSDQDVARWRRSGWLVAESLRQYAQEIRRKLNGELERPWRVILTKPMTALRHRQHNVY
jgi:hypothetical protein